MMPGKSLYKLWQLNQKDICQYEWKSLPVSLLGLKRRGKDMDVATFLKRAIENVKETTAKNIWQNWVVNMDDNIEDSYDIYEAKINQTLGNKLDYLSSSVFGFIREFFVAELEKLLFYPEKIKPNMINKHHLMHAIAGLGHMEMEFDDNYSKVMDTEGVDNLNEDNAREIASKLLDGLGMDKIVLSIRNIRERIRSIILKTAPFQKDFYSFWAKFKSGKNTIMEKMLLNYFLNELSDIAESPQDYFISLEDICEYRNNALQHVYRGLVQRFFQTASKSINENNKIDATKFADLWNNDERLEPYGEAFSMIERYSGEAEEGIVSGDFVFQIMKILIFERNEMRWQEPCRNGSQDNREECERLMGVSSQQLSAGIVAAVVEYLL